MVKNTGKTDKTRKTDKKLYIAAWVFKTTRYIHHTASFIQRNDTKIKKIKEKCSGTCICRVSSLVSVLITHATFTVEYLITLEDTYGIGCV